MPFAFQPDVREAVLLLPAAGGGKDQAPFPVSPLRLFLGRRRFPPVHFPFLLIVHGTEEIYRHGDAWLRVLSSVEFDPEAFLRSVREKGSKYGAQRQAMSLKFADEQQRRTTLRCGEAQGMPGWTECLTESLMKVPNKTYTHWSLMGCLDGERFRIEINDELDFAVTEPVWRKIISSLSYSDAPEAAARSAGVSLPRPSIPGGVELTPELAAALAGTLDRAAAAAEKIAAADSTSDPRPDDWGFRIPDWPWTPEEARRRREDFAAEHALPPRVEIPFSKEGPAVFLLVPPGRFVMGGFLQVRGSGNMKAFSAGSGKAPGKKSFLPEVAHPVTLGRVTRPFYMMATPVTQEMWQSVTGDNPSLFKGDADSPFRPVENVSYNDMTDRFLPAATAKHLAGAGLALRLPDGMEWEYACRAGSAGAYPAEPFSAAVANYSGLRSLAAVQGTGTPKSSATTPVGAYPPNNWGFYDMAGNVAEICTDDFIVQPSEFEVKLQARFQEALDRLPQDVLAQHLAGAQTPETPPKIIRGGSYQSDDIDCASFEYRPHPVDMPDSSVGFRLVLSVKTKTIQHSSSRR